MKLQILAVLTDRQEIFDAIAQTLKTLGSQIAQIEGDLVTVEYRVVEAPDSVPIVRKHQLAKQTIHLRTSEGL